VVNARVKTGQAPEYVTNGAAELIFGLDIRLTDFIDLRAIDYGAAAGTSNNGSASAVEFLGAGLVYHFHPADKPASRNPEERIGYRPAFSSACDSLKPFHGSTGLEE
jgi:hypothetical protein